jgi:galactokinase
MESLYEEAFGEPCRAVASAPGRLEVLGNHTDYNEGFVLSCAVDRFTHVEVGPAPGAHSEAASAAFGGEVCRVGEARWTRYIAGAIEELAARGHRVPPLRAAVTSHVPPGVGMASSAALEVALVRALDAWLGLGLGPEAMARIGQAAEGRAVGAPTGLMDQLTCLMVQRGQLLLSEYRDLTLRQINLPEAVSFVVVDSGVSHDLSSEYAERRRSCERAVRALAAQHPHVRALRDVTPAMLEGCDGLTDEERAHARHVVTENQRVHQGIRALESGELATFGQLLFDSHESSRRDFHNSHPILDRLVDLGRSDPRCLGARLSGGGFGGVTIHLVAGDVATEYAAHITRRFEEAHGQTPRAFVCATADGAWVGAS